MTMDALLAVLLAVAVGLVWAGAYFAVLTLIGRILGLTSGPGEDDE